MKKLCSTIMMLAMIVAALGFASCGSDEEDSENAIVGIWDITAIETNKSASSIIGEQFCFNADGSFTNGSVIGRWSLNGTSLTINLDNQGSYVFIVKRLIGSELILYYSNEEYSITMYMKKVGSGDNNKEGTSGIPSSGDYLQVTLNGKTYTDKILEWHYAQLDPVGRDADNKPLTLTYDMCDHFEKYGFTFLFGVVHYSRKSDLLSSSVGSYGCSEDMLQDDYYRNLTFWSTLEIDYNEYKWKSGTHQVKSIKEVGDKVQIEGSFTSNFEYDGNKRTVKGNYRITIP